MTESEIAAWFLMLRLFVGLSPASRTDVTRALAGRSGDQKPAQWVAGSASIGAGGKRSVPKITWAYRPSISPNGPSRAPAARLFGGYCLFVRDMDKDDDLWSLGSNRFGGIVRNSGVLGHCQESLD
jgi:hypothetical protein